MNEDDKKAEQEEQVKLVTEIIAAKCKESKDDYQAVQAIGDALKNGDNLIVKVLSGGQTNYSFKITLENDPSTARFAKLSYSYALWNPDRSQKYDLERATNEFDIMQRFRKMMGGSDPPVPQVYYCLDVPSVEAKLLISEWAPADEQFARQFAEGHVDKRVLLGVAEALATLNLAPAKYEWNEKCRGCMRSLHPLFKQISSGFCELPPEKTDSCVLHCKELGIDKLHTIVDKLDKEYMETRQVLCHNDTKQFNIMVEKRPSPETFGEKGTFALVDWEMSIKGKSGKDAGIFQALPIASAYCHAVQGHEKEAYHLLDTIKAFWNAYEKALTEKGDKDEAYLLDAFKGSLGASYLYLYAGYYILGIDAEFLPLQGVPEETAGKAKGAIGKTGLQVGEIAYLGKHADLSLEELKNVVFKDLIEKEIDSLLKASAGRVLPRRASHTMVSGRRASDALMMEKAAHRMSHQAETGGRASIYGLSVSMEMLDLDEDDE